MEDRLVELNTGYDWRRSGHGWRNRAGCRLAMFSCMASLERLAAMLEDVGRIAFDGVMLRVKIDCGSPVHS